MIQNSIWIYEVILFIYAISLVGYGFDVLRGNWRIKQVAFGLLTLAWVLQSGVLIHETIQTGTLPILSLVDVLYVYAWILLSCTLAISSFTRIPFLELCINVFAFLMLALAAGLDVKQQGLNEKAHIIHEILVAHISFTILAYVFFTFSFFLSAIYLLQHWLLRKKKGFHWIWRFTDLKKLDEYSFTSILIGVPLLFIGLSLGFVWAYTSGSEFYWMDLKTVGSIILLGIYIVYLLLRQLRGYRGKPISIYNSATFMVLLVNFFLFSVLSNFHF